MLGVRTAVRCAKLGQESEEEGDRHTRKGSGLHRAKGRKGTLRSNAAVWHRAVLESP